MPLKADSKTTKRRYQKLLLNATLKSCEKTKFLINQMNKEVLGAL